jgi:hypothetical protein
MAKRTYVTFSEGDDYKDMCDILVEGISHFSQYDILVYSASDFDEEWDIENWPHGYSYKFKIMSCLKALREYDEVVWIDSDVVVTSDIDLIWNKKVDNYPLLPKYRFENFIRWPQPRGDMRNFWELTQGKEKVGLDHTDFENIYCQACVMLLNKRCESFLKDVLYYFNDFDSSCFPFGDETIINLLLWKYKYSNNLGDVFLCSHYFSHSHILRVLDVDGPQSYQDLFNPNIKDPFEEGFFVGYGGDYGLHNRLGVIDCSKRPLFFHGAKSADLHRNILNHIISKKNG